MEMRAVRVEQRKNGKEGEGKREQSRVGTVEQRE
jgi:hypothetical protein